MATEFIHSLRAAGGDYTLGSTWEGNLQSDLTAAASKVFSHGGITGTVSHGATVTGQTSSATGTVTGVVTSTQIYLTSISGTFQSGEEFRVTAGNSVTSSDAGDSCLPVLECYNDWASGLDDKIKIDTSWTTSATNYPTIRAAAGHAHRGIPGTGFHIRKSDNFGILIDSDVDHVHLEYLDVDNTSTNANSVGVAFSNKTGHLIGCLVSAGGTAVTQIGDESVLRTSIAYDATDGLAMVSNSGSITVDNCIAANNSDEGFRQNGTATVNLRNCIAFNNGTNWSLLAGSWGGSNNAADDASTTTPPGTSPFLTDIVSGDFAGEPNNDFHLAFESNLIAEGVDPGTFTLDFDGDTFPATWPIGPDHAFAIHLVDVTSVYIANWGGGGGIDLVVPEAAGIQDDDVLIFDFTLRDGTGPIAFSAGTEIDNIDEGSFQTARYSIVAASESGAYTATAANWTGADGWGSCTVWRGVDPDDIFEPNYVEATHHLYQSGSTDGLTWTPKPITTETDGAMVVVSALIRNGGGSDVTAISVPSGYASAVEYVAGTTAVVAAEVSYKEKASLGVETVGDITVTLDTSNDVLGGLYTLALKPLAGGADVIPPNVSLPTTTAETRTGSTLGATTDEANGTSHCIVVANGDESLPTNAEVIAGTAPEQILKLTNKTITAAAAYTHDPFIGVAPGTTFGFVIVHVDAASNEDAGSRVEGTFTTLAAFTESEVFVGPTIPSTSILHYGSGTHTGANNAAALTTALTFTLDQLAGLLALNTTDVSQAFITGNTAGANSVVSGPLSGGTDNDWDTSDGFDLTAAIDNPDVVYCENQVSVVSEEAPIKWYMEDISTGLFSAEFDQTITGLTGVADGTYSVALADDGSVTLTLIDVTAPVLSSPTGTKTGHNTATGTVSTDEGNGILYYYASTNATETAATIKASGSSQAVSATGAQNVSFYGLTPATVYYAHYVHDDAIPNESNVVNSTSFTTDAAPVSSGGLVDDVATDVVNDLTIDLTSTFH